MRRKNASTPSPARLSLITVVFFSLAVSLPLEAQTLEKPGLSQVLDLSLLIPLRTINRTWAF